METDEHNNKNLGDTQAENSADRSNMPDNQVPRHRSNDHEQINRVKSDAGFLSREVGEGDFGLKKQGQILKKATIIKTWMIL